MSVRVMSLVWDNFRRGGTEKLAMLALADWCNDTGGSLHPSVAALAKKICCSESQARRILHGFIREGLLTVVGNETGGAPGTTRQYELDIAMLRAGIDDTPRTGTSGTPRAGTDARGQEAETASTDARGSTGARGSMGARDGLHPCAERASTGASQTIIEPSVNHQNKAVRPRALGIDFLVGRGVDAKVARDWLIVRNAKRSPLTETAWERLEREAERAGIQPVDAVLVCVERGWVGFNSSWNWRDGAVQARPENPPHQQRLSLAERSEASERDASKWSL